MLKWLLLFFLFLYLAGRLIRFFYRTTTDHDQVHYATTEDGFLLALYRYLPKEKNDGLPPVICCHGLVENRFIYDLGHRSLARYLSGRGHEVWLLELRGQGDSRRRTAGRKFHWNWDFDDHAFRDLPAAVELVCKQTGADKVNWIGHSMGGMILYANLAKNGPENRIHRAVTLGSPGSFSSGSKLFKVILAVEPLIKIKKAPMTFLNDLWLFWAEIGLVRLAFMANPKNLTAGWYQKFLVNAIQSTGMKLVSHFAHFIRHKCFSSRTGDRFDYRANLGNFKVPLLAVAGDRDGLVPPFRVKRVYDEIGSAEKKYLEVGKTAGHPVGYGHCDLIIGDRVDSEVWPQAADWLEKV